MNKYYLIILLVMLLLDLLPAQTEAEYIEIGSFNIEWFPCKDDGEMMRRYGIQLGNPPQGEATDIPALFALLKELDIELLGVVEIVDPMLLQKNARRYLGSNYRVVYAPSRSSQKVGFLYDTSVLRLKDSLRVYWDVALDTDSFLRPALGAYFQYKDSGFDFYALIVHLKARPSGLKIRKKQWQALGEIINDMLTGGSEKDLILMGDFNNVSELGANEFRPLMMDSLHFFWSGDSLIKKGMFTNFWEPRPDSLYLEGSLIDHLFVSPGARNELLPQTIRSAGMCAEGKKRFYGNEIPLFYRKISDHCPVFATFRADRDDD